MAFTRHPTALATAYATILSLKLRPAQRVLLETLVTRCDRQGVYWGKVTEEVARLTGLRPQTIRVAARVLRALGLIEWGWIRPHKRYPLRKNYDQPVTPGRGKRDSHGGRVWVVQWAALGVGNFGSAVVDRLIRTDQSGVIQVDQSSDPLGSPSENLSSIPHSPSAATASPGGSTGIGRSQAPALVGPLLPAALTPPARPAAEETIASETPGAAAAAPAARRGQGPADRSRELERDGRDSERSRGEPSAPMTREALEASLAWLYRPGSGPTPPPPPHRTSRRPPT